MRNAFADTLYAAACDDPAIVVVVADISPAGSMEKFRVEFPQRFVNVGVAEQSMIGLCAGLALKGCQPFAYTIATFALYRPFEFVRDDLCYQNLPVTVVGIGGGVVYSVLGGTHHCQEDVAIASALPNMAVLAPCDPLETRAATLWCARQKRGPVYLRLGKAGEPVLTADAPEPFEFGRLRLLKPGRDVCILSYGVIMKEAFAVAAGLEARGQSAAVASVHTLKPLDRDGVARVLRDYARVVVIEEHSPFGGLAAQVKALAWDMRAGCRLDAFTLQDAFPHAYGSHDEVLAAHGLTAAQMLAALDA